jgi:thioredoxin reductase (NADPH)
MTPLSSRRLYPGGLMKLTRPALFVIDQDPSTLNSLLSMLERRFGNDFRLMGDSRVRSGLDSLREMSDAGEEVALLLVDEASSEFLATAHSLHPRAKRVLLIDRDYSSTSPAVQTMALGRADFHIVRPWADPEMVYRAVGDFLSSWAAEHGPEFTLFDVIAMEGDSRLHQVRDVLTRFSLPFKFHPADGESGRRLLAAAGLDGSRLPVLIRYDGHATVDPTLSELARAIGVSVENDVDTCDLVIVGAGPAGLTAAVYAASEGLSTVLLDQGVSGGQAGSSPLIRNYPGFPNGISGGLLMERTCEQAWLMGAHIVFSQQVVGLESRGDRRRVFLANGDQISARAVVISTGVEWRRLGVPAIDAFVGSGVFYGAAVSESRAMRDQVVFVVGAGNSAGQAAVSLSGYAQIVTLLVRGDSYAASMSRYLVRTIEATPNITVRHCTVVTDGGGEDRLERLTLADRETNSVETVPAGALFVMIGGEPHTDWLAQQVGRDLQGYVITGRELQEGCDGLWTEHRAPLALETSMPGVFAAGDVRRDSIKRVASAVGEGATVVRLVHEYLSL